MRRGVSEEVEGECRPSNISFPAIKGLSTSSTVTFSSWLPSLNVFAPMGQALSPGSSFRARNITLNGLRLTKISGMLIFNVNLHETYPTISIGMSENGWTDDSLCTQWFRESFIPQATQRNDSRLPILLIYDGHGSHTTPEMRQLAEENNIELFCLPAHTTHRMQPLDVGVFGPMQCCWQEQCDEVLEATDCEIQKINFVREYMVAREKAFKPETIKKAWAKCGICPLNPNIFTEADFAPSTSSSRHARLPGTYPAGHDSDDSDFETGSESSGEDNASERGDDDSGADSGDEVDGHGRDTDGVAHIPIEGFGVAGTDVTSHPISELLPAVPTSAVSPSQLHTRSPDRPIPINTPAPSLPHHTELLPRAKPNPALVRTRPFLAPTQHHTLSASLPYTGVGSHPTRAELSDENARLQVEIRALQAKLDTAQMHANMARLETEELQRRHNAKQSKNTALPTVTSATGWLTLEQGKVLHQQQEAMRSEKRWKKDESVARKEQEEVDKQQQQRVIVDGEAAGFSGAISTKRVAELRNIAYVLGLNDEGTKDQLAAVIKSHFDTNPASKTKPLFIGLFSAARGQKRHAPADTGDENVLPPSSRQRTEASDTPIPVVPSLLQPIARPSRLPIPHLPLQGTYIHHNIPFPNPVHNSLYNYPTYYNPPTYTPPARPHSIPHPTIIHSPINPANFYSNV